jgi:hypothetical protein
MIAIMLSSLKPLLVDYLKMTYREFVCFILAATLLRGLKVVDDYVGPQSQVGFRSLL